MPWLFASLSDSGGRAGIAETDCRLNGLSNGFGIPAVFRSDIQGKADKHTGMESAKH
jgi:hypothetical protein